MITLAPMTEQLLVELYFGADLGQDVTAAARVFELVSSAGEPLCPQAILVNGKPRPFSAERAASTWNASDDREVVLTRSDRSMWSMTGRSLGRKNGAMCKFAMQVPLAIFDRGTSDALVSALEAIAGEYPCLYGFADMSWDYMLGQKLVDDLSRMTMVQFTEVYWLNLLGARLVKQFGAERVRATPADGVQVLPNGTVAIRTRPTPTDYYTLETSDARARALAHLRPDLDANEIRTRLRSRAQTLAPVERDWDPDIARLLEYTLLLVPLDDRRARERAYNTLRPEVGEWRPAATALAAEIDIAEATRTYSRDAENLRIAVGKRLDIEDSSEPEWLEKLDALFWTYAHNYFDTPAHVDKMVSVIGGFLGTMLVKELGGQWVPRRDPAETAVIIGDRAWLPFLRARHYAKSKETIVEYALMKFFREAERCRHAASAGRKTSERG